MIPRYLPAVHLASWTRWLFSGRTQSLRARAQLLTGLDCGTGFSARAFPRARHALQAYFRHGLGSADGRHVLMSAQICPLVPLLAHQNGFEVRFLDTDGTLPVPSAEAFAEAIDKRTAAVIVAPMYGLISSGFSALRARLRRQPDTKLILDLAQGLGMTDEIDELRQAADALVFSFGVGKGLDCGGGLLLTRVPFQRARRRQPTSVLPLVQTLGLRTVCQLGAYRWLAGSLDSAVEEDKQTKPLPEARASRSIFRLWQTRLSQFLSEVTVARSRSQLLSEVAIMRAACRDAEHYFGGPGTHLRQIVRLRNPANRDPLLAHLRRGEIDAAPAGEPLPSAYYPGAETTLFPNAIAFRRDALRLPFLGRLSERQFEYLVHQMESYGALNLSA